jgi:hypothetical protein
MKEMQNENKPIDLILMIEKLGSRIEDIGVTYMTCIINRQIPRHRGHPCVDLLLLLPS